MSKLVKVLRRGSQLEAIFDDGSRATAYPTTTSSLWLIRGGGDDPDPPDPGGGGWQHPLGPDWPRGQWTTYPGSPDHEAGAVDFGTGYGGTPPLYAPCDGKVVYVGDDGVGNPVLTIQPHGLPEGVSYLHMNRIDVSVGQTVTGGQQVGIVGWQGKVEPPGPGGAHLHLEVKKQALTWGSWYAAVPYFASKGVTL